ncbi:MAG: glycosyl hydrolase [Chthoniobacterales bacterium]
MKALRETWQMPPLGETYVGFWTFNHIEVEGQLSEDEVCWQLDEMYSKGIREVVIFRFYSHDLPYLSDRWRKIVEAIFAHCKKRSMKVWLWDEDCWPSGNAGGALTQEHPEYRARILSHKVQDVKGGKRVKLAISEQFPVSVSAVEVGGNRIIDLMPYIGPCDTEWAISELNSAYLAPASVKDTIFTTTAERHSPQYKLDWEVPAGTWKVVSFLINEGQFYHGWLADTLNPEAVHAWLQKNQEWYWKHFKQYFGSTLKGFYSAEPPHTRWTPKLWEYFRKMKGYDLKPLAAHLAMDISERSARIRMDYQEVHSKLYAHHFIRQTRQWCEKHGVLYMCRLGYEERPAQMMAEGGNLMTAIREFSVQASDLINGIQIGDREHADLNVGANVSYSISRQLGTSSYTEVFPIGLNWKGNLADTRALFDWTLILGSDQASHTLMTYSIDGYRKLELPPSYFYQSPEWEYFDRFALRFDRLGAMVRSGKDIRRVALLFPVSSLAVEVVGFEWRSKAAKKIDRDFVGVHQALLETHIPFDILDEAVVGKAGTGARQLHIDKARYDYVIIPPCSYLSEESCKTLNAFIRAGGRVIRFSQEIQEVLTWKHKGHKRSWKPRGTRTVHTTRELVALAELRALQIASLPPEVLSRRIETTTGEILMVLNTASRKIGLNWPSPADGWEKWCADSGKQEPASEQTLGARELGVYVRERKRKALPASEASILKQKPVATISLDSEWKFSGLRNCLYLDKWDICMDVDFKFKPEEIPKKHWHLLPYQNSNLVKVGALRTQVDIAEPRKKLNPIPMWVLNGTSAKDEILPKYFPVPVYYRNVFLLEPNVSKDLLLLMETDGVSGDWRIWINGHEIRQKDFRFERIFDVGNRVTECSKYLLYGKVNEIVIYVNATQATDGLLQPLRILGDFRINDQPRPQLVPAQPTMLTGSWTLQGYPHASGRGRYQQTIKLDPALVKRKLRWVLDCGEVRDSCRVYANGKIVDTRLWKPFDFDLTPYAQKSVIDLVIEVANNSGNLIAGESKGSGLLGPVRVQMFPMD